MKGRPRFGVWIPREAVNECDELAWAHRETGSQEDLHRLWQAVEPWVARIACSVWSRASYRIGNIVEPDDLVSLGKELFLGRLLRLWRPDRGSFLVYVAATVRIEFVKTNWKLMRLKSRQAQELDVQSAPADSEFEEIETRLMIGAGIRMANGCGGDGIDWSLGMLSIPLRELARLNGGKKGFSKSNLHARRSAILASIERECMEGEVPLGEGL